MIASLRQFFSFPLLVKELTETAARRRTYVLRIVYAVLLYGLFFYTLPSSERHAFDPQLGVGKRMLDVLGFFQIAGIILFLPALMCGRITQEKERDSLSFLLLTDLSPWSIVWQKYVGGLMPMLTFLFLGLPLTAVAYALGGLETEYILRVFAAMVVACLQIGALALFCSAWCRTTVGAFLLTYALGAVIYAGPFLLLSLLEFLLSFPLSSGVPINPSWDDLGQYAHLHFPSNYPEAEDIRRYGRVAAHIQAFYYAPLFLVALLLGLARFSLVRRAFVRPSQLLPRFFRWIDRCMKAANWITGGFVFWQARRSLPEDEPVFWRETQSRALGQTHYLLRLLYLVEIPTILIAVAIGLGSYFGTGEQNDELSLLLAFLSLLAMLTLSVQAANSLVSERLGQTLEVLLTTPLSTAEIIRQKDRALRRLQLLVAAPLLTVIACEAFFETGRRATDARWFPYLVCGVLLVVIYLPLITWLSLWIGLRVRNRIQAILGALGVLVVWSALGPFLLDRSPEHLSFVAVLSPLSVPILNETDRLDGTVLTIPGPWPMIILNAVLYALLALFIRHRLYITAERRLRAT